MFADEVRREYLGDERKRETERGAALSRSRSQTTLNSSREVVKLTVHERITEPPPDQQEVK